ncbi:filamentous hemagglutinin N-terminal domain-containing protein [Pantanalinema sp. GBBB05]|uniref:two-partner secretion domain-containing protein n=1 Tax=Pantanalinema sp. GBBB05 TaxID=2604139 RepID=UPI003D81C4B1
MHYWSGCCSFLLATVGMTLPAHAQVVSDGTLNTTVTQSGNNFTITNGTTQGNNLFHSFSQFSVPTGGSTFFNNATTIQNIFARVTGGSVSNIDGLIRANGTANLFLLNPSGILFGPNAVLNIGGSFIGTTANSIKFADGVEFSATNSSGPPLLTISVPIGLQMGSSPGAITVQNTGHRLAFPINPFASSPDRSNNPVGLSVTTGNTLALVGGEITLDGGVLNAFSGHIELGSAKNGIVHLNTASPSWSFDYGNLQPFGNIQLLHQSLADASGSPAGSIHFQGRNVSLNDASAALLVNQGSGNAGDIRVNASESLELRGTGTPGFPQSLLRADNLGDGTGGNIKVSAANVLLQDGGSLHGFSFFGAGTSSNISVEVGDLLQIVGLSPISGFASSLNTNTTGSGKSGDIRVVTSRLQILGGAVIGSSSNASGAGGSTTINASKFIEISGEDAQSLADSVIVVGTFGQGPAGRLTINTPTLRVRDGGGIVASTVNSGNGGDLIVNATDSIEVSGVGSISRLPSRIGARAELLAPPIRKLFGLPDVITGNTGKLTLNTPRLQVTDGAIVGVDHQGIGNAGDLHINAATIFLDRAGSITASTQSGVGGSIQLNANLLLLRHGSNITATAGGAGNGGNITINAPVIVGIENSDIVANAVKGRGGNIQITTQGIIGLQYRPQLTPENDITASSEFGVNGTVQVNNIGVDPNSGLVELPTKVVDSSQQIATGCAGSQGSSFIATGRGGVPQNPVQQVRDDRTWNDMRDLSAYRKAGKTVAQSPAAVPVLIQANTWQRHADGTVELIADQASAMNPTFATCSGVTASELESAP